MSALTAVMLFAGFAAVICVRARAAGPALLFGVVTLVLLAATPVGAAMGQLVQLAMEFGEQAAAQTGGAP